MAIQVQQSTTGEYVIHKITFIGVQGRFSAWFSADGTMTDCEQILTSQRVTPEVRKVSQRQHNIRRRLQEMGKIHRPKDELAALRG